MFMVILNNKLKYDDFDKYDLPTLTKMFYLPNNLKTCCTIA